MTDKKLKIGITGGIGTGKSEVSKIIKKSDYHIILADDLAKDIMKTDEKVKKKIIDEFGNESYLNGNLNTKFLAKTVFSDPAKVVLINSIVHPPTIKKIKSLMEESLKNSNLVFVEAALIYEAEMENLFDYIILVASDEKYQIERVKNRDGISEEEVRKRIENQIPQDEKRNAADFVIENNSTIEDLLARTNFILHLLKSMTL